MKQPKTLRLGRAFVVYALLMEKKEINIKALADVFKCSERTIYRDIALVKSTCTDIRQFIKANYGIFIIGDLDISEKFSVGKII